MKHIDYLTMCSVLKHRKCKYLNVNDYANILWQYHDNDLHYCAIFMSIMISNYCHMHKRWIPCYYISKNKQTNKTKTSYCDGTCANMVFPILQYPKTCYNTTACFGNVGNV